MAARNVVTRRSCHFRGLLPSLKNGKSIPWESQLEGCFLSLLELSPRVLRYDVQPSKETFAMSGYTAIYYPDVRAVMHDGTEQWFEVKPAARLITRHTSSRMEAIEDHFKQTNRVFSVVSDEHLLAEPFSNNLRDLMYYRRSMKIIDCDPESSVALLKAYQPRTINELCELFGREKAWHLLGLGYVGMDLEKPLAPCTPIYLQGGHRHGNFFA
ncbi:TnsA endonuclease N-terminal domain-containing protein [Pseudomonas cichorii]|uniref:TnsA endonuclease N-terminal domain-containing protein n=1 Tax=Pseudomonas cichorii TaxID=36746 RepID=UPI001C8A45B8|nr:TnsA endonuclease N-terminal domain-containing protein [Pseudomonas cichorii]MBX8573804.1 transposase [Pseudomonas cichorii]